MPCRDPRFVQSCSSALATALAIVLLASAASARSPGEPGPEGDTTPSLYALDPEPRREKAEPGMPAVAGVQQAFAIDLDPALVASDPERLELELPSGTRVTALRLRSVVYDPEWTSWSGRVHDPAVDSPDGASGYLHLVYHGDRVTGVLDVSEGAFQIRGPGGREHRLLRVGASAEAACGVELYREHLEDFEMLPLDLPDQASAGAAKPGKAATRIDVLALFTRDFHATPAMQGAMTTFVQTSISMANDAFTNSNVPAEYNLVHLGPLMGDQPANLDDIFNTISWLRTATNDPNSEVGKLRDAYGADMVTLFIPIVFKPGRQRPDACGVANTPHSTNSIGDLAVTIHRSDCGLNDITFAHELGHNYGMLHDDEDDLIPNQSFAFGHLLTDLDRASLMGCTCGESPKVGCVASQVVNEVCDRIPYFSDPAIDYPPLDPDPVPTGTTDRNNAQVARLQVGSYAAFRPIQTGISPPNALFTANCQAFRCTFDAGISSDNGFIPASGYAWDFVDGSPVGTGQVVEHVFPAAGTYRVRLVVTDNTGHRGFASAAITVSDTTAPRRFVDVPGHNQLVGPNQLVRGWATDDSGVDTITFQVDGQPVTLSNFVYGLHRADVCNAHADLNDPNCPQVGWQGRLDTAGLALGQHTLSVTVTDIAGNSAAPFNRKLLAPCPWPVGHQHYCRDCGPCAAGEGDCDGNAECSGALFCQNDVGAQFGFDPLVDVCVAGCQWPVGHQNYCRDCGPCTAGQGDCDNNAECAGSLVCRHDVGAQFGFSPLTDVCNN
ncbi:MAG: PKD domain-containing protein [Holophagales bacterium]|nr:PKD domain-containing protein [Holophagales bacterium]